MHSTRRFPKPRSGPSIQDNKLTIQAVPTDRTYGLAFNRYITPFGDLLVRQHPLMSHSPTWRKDGFAIDTYFVSFHVRKLTFDPVTVEEIALV